MVIMKDDLKRQIAHLPPLARARAERELGLKTPKAEHRVFVYGTLLSGERNARCALGARREAAMAKGTIYDTASAFRPLRAKEIPLLRASF